MTAMVGPLGFTDLDPEGMLIMGFDKLGTNRYSDLSRSNWSPYGS